MVKMAGRAILVYLVLNCLVFKLAAQQNMRVPLLPDEQWFGAAVSDGAKQPFEAGYSLTLLNNTAGNQAAPLLISTKGRYIWCDEPLAFKFTNTDLEISGGRRAELKAGGLTLRDAYLAASRHHFKASGKIPAEILFTHPQWNTWIELIYNQNQQDILKYAHEIIAHGFKPGVLMIDDNWAPYYGNFEFRRDRFADAKAMVAELHRLGFKVMVWVCPFITADSEVGRLMMKQGWVLPGIVKWWNGYSLVMDLEKQAAFDWYKGQLEGMQRTYGIDGFKLDAGDPEYYTGVAGTSGNNQTELWGKMGLHFNLNEYRAMWKMGGQPIGERLADKNHYWTDLQLLIPQMLTAGLIGHSFACADMVGGGDFSSFINRSAATLDQDLVVRWAQCSALMPMMQFSAAPWRILDDRHMGAIKQATTVRATWLPLILKLVKEAGATGEPVVRHMEYVFSNQGFAGCKDQFMLGDSLLVAPMVTPGNSRVVMLPRGRWKDNTGKVWRGSKQITISVPLSELPLYRRL